LLEGGKLKSALKRKGWLDVKGRLMAGGVLSGEPSRDCFELRSIRQRRMIGGKMAGSSVVLFAVTA